MDSVTKYIKGEIASIIKWVVGLYDDLSKYATDLYHWALSEFDYLTKWLSSQVAALINWVIANIWQPLYTSLSGAIQWILKDGAWLWDVVSNPDKLVAWIARYLLDAWLSILTRYAKPIVQYLLKQSMALVPDLVSLLEDVISKVL